MAASLAIRNHAIIRRLFVTHNIGQGFRPFDTADDENVPTVDGSGKLAVLWGGFGMGEKQVGSEQGQNIASVILLVFQLRNTQLPSVLTV